MSYKATIIEIRHNRAIVMTDQCDFKEISLKHPAEVGDTVDYLGEDILNKPGYSKIPTLVASVLLCCLLISSLLYKSPPGQVYAFVSFDINPSFQLGIDKEYRVVEARGFNQDGQLLLNQCQISGITLEQAVSNIFIQNFDALHLNRAEENYLLVTVYFPDNQVDAGFINNFNNLLSGELGTNHVRATLFCLNIDNASYERALEQNVSPGRWILWQAARESGFNFDLYGNLPWSENWLRELAYGKAQQTVQTPSDNGINNTFEDKRNATNPDPVQKPADSTNKPSSDGAHNKQSSEDINDSPNSPGNGLDSTNSEPSSNSNGCTAGSSVSNSPGNAAEGETTGSTNGSGSTGGSNNSSGPGVSSNSSTGSSGSNSNSSSSSSEGSGGTGSSGSDGGSSGSDGVGGGGR